MTHRLRACAAVVLAMSACTLLSIGLPAPAFAHGFAGKRFFPATLATDDPFVADELSLPTVSSTNTKASGDDPAARTTATSIDYTKRITPSFGVGLSATGLRMVPDGGDTGKGAGLPEPFKRMIPILEVSLQKPIDRGRGPTTGTWNPGVLWAGRYMQFGIEAILPINSSSPVRHGWIAQIHFFMDDLFPRSFGWPMVGA